MRNYETLKLELENDVLKVILNRGNANPINVTMMKELIDLADWLREESEIKFVVFTNNGKFFSAGFDLYDFTGERSMHILGHELMRKLENIEQITIAAIRGSAYGGGVAIATTTDFRFITKGSVFSLPETNVGMFLSWGCTPRLVKSVGAVKAKEMIMLCEDASAEVCLQLGLVNKVVQANEMDDEISQLIEKIRKKGQHSIRLTKKMINASVAVNIGDILITEPELVERVMLTGETGEKINQFSDKKKKK